MRQDSAPVPAADAKPASGKRGPPGHRIVLAFFLAILITMLLVQGLSTRTTGRSATASAGTRSALPGRGAILSYEHGALVTRERSAKRQIALSFDDGPDPHWTPLIASTLKRLHVPATFFVIGSEVVRHPEIVRRLQHDGFELGNHTFTHAYLEALPGWERSLQIGLTESAVADATGFRPRLLRPPYSSVRSAVTPGQSKTLIALARQGYVIVLSDFDSNDWRRPGVDAIVRSITPRTRSGGIVLMHDGGGNRAQTLAAVERVIPRLKRRGFRFVSVSQLAHLSRGEVEVPATRFERLRGRMLRVTLAAARLATAVFAVMLALLGLLTVLRMAILLVLARRHARSVRTRTANTEHRPSVSIVVPALNEAVGIERTVRALAASDYPTYEVIVVDDGSTDGTAALVDQLGLPCVRVLRQPNLGKPAALNAGIAAATSDLVVTVDADTVFEAETLRRLVAPFSDPAVGAASGNTKVGNRKRLIGRWQHIEYVMGFNLDRRLYHVLRCMPTVPGAVGAFRREALAQVGGFSAATLAEDTDMTIAIGRAGWRVVYAEDARAWTEAPASLSGLWRQRYRWSYGTMQAVWKHKAALWRRGEGRIGRRGIPYLIVFQITLPLLAPLVDLFALYGALFLSPWRVLVYWVGFNVLQLVLAVYAFRLDRESPRTLWAMPMQQFVYRQLMYMVVIESVMSALAGVRLHWHRVERTGDVEIMGDATRGGLAPARAEAPPRGRP
jgi:cellulose synthase/poly-beta-1,6-N-acetylglucosamine synthase-like glycosyltransferase/peptidoglycan/xylan/chitin deacetylase (PgdA/CDA1 family)